MDISVIVPVYNGEKTIIELFNRIKNILDGRFSYEVIFVHDCGKDNSWGIIQELMNSYPSLIKGYNLQHNYGQHKALLFGITKACGDFIVTIDEDLEHDPYFIPALITEQKKGNYDVVYGKFENLEHPVVRIITSEFLRRILKKLIPELYPDYSSYRLIKRETGFKIAELKNSYSFIDGYIGWTTNKIGSVLIKHYKRAGGSSSYTLCKLFKHAILIILAYSRIKIYMLVSALILNFTALGLYFYNVNFEKNMSKSIILILFASGFVLLLLTLNAEIIHYNMFRKNIKPVKIK